MGILDDAIRQHLDLKRLHGAEDSEVKRLEDEAFGLPTRPGEPDFPDSEEQTAVATEPRVEGDDAGSEAATALLGDETATPAPEAPPEPPAEEPSAMEHQAIEAPPEAPAAERADAPGPESPAFFDQASGEELDLDELDLDLSDEEEPPPPAAEAPAPEQVDEEIASDEHPVVGLETEEHPMEEELEAPATGEEPLEPASEELPVEDQLAEPESGEHPAEPESGEADVLEETPEFLRDQPEDDELWFEQGEPKDFDFD